ncbi:hypothetical protein M0534_00830 [Methylonatrum kenyense]|uniref:hypothetical protein n=1 Tax=Methylonatrum kenyense TaxID=455253 RepID=UPI0020BF2C54|nr:hypothetical protein [Methylonatrum kenyense]MCK8514876.1 hypothetical protein [Methylonatrum kenyense]
MMDSETAALMIAAVKRGELGEEIPRYKICKNAPPNLFREIRKRTTLKRSATKQSETF